MGKEEKWIEDTVNDMTVEELTSQLTYESKEVKRFGIPAYNWWNEGLHGVARAGTATVFPQAICLASSFDERLIYDVGTAISVEARAKYNAAVERGDRDIYKGLTLWAPNINIYRDPRWGRGQETYGEDPTLTALLAKAYVKGIQGNGEYLRAAACLKHFAVHSGPERIRHEFDAVVSKKDLFETYLRAFEVCVKEVRPEGVMGAYNRINGVPCCGNGYLIEEILREKWGFDGYFVSDCGAIADFHQYHKVTKTPYESAVMALTNGCDLNCGQIYAYVLGAWKKGMIDEKYIRRAVRRLLRTRYRLGLFDKTCEYNKIGYEENDSAKHRGLALKAARESIVLLKNDGILPLNKNEIKSIAVIGPNADSREVLMGNYCGTASEHVTFLEGIRKAAGKKVRIYYTKGCDLYKDYTNQQQGQKDDGIAEAEAAVQKADIAVLCLGFDASIEGEQGDVNNPEGAGDRKDLSLPGRQEYLLRKILETGKKVIVLLSGGGAISLNGCEEKCAAIAETWYPGAMGGRAAADILFGKCSPCGKLPVTFYKSADDLPLFEDYSMEGRTYRYFKKMCLYPFGYGLTYSEICIERGELCDAADKRFVGISLWVKNTGSRNVKEVIQIYIKNLESRYAVPNYTLAAIKKISILAGEQRKVSLKVPYIAFEVVDDNGERLIDGSSYEIYAGVSQPDPYSVRLCGVKPWTFAYTMK